MGSHELYCRGCVRLRPGRATPYPGRFECCPGFECADPGSKIACCANDCDIVYHEPPHQPSPAIHVVLAAGGAQLTFDRTLKVEGNSGRRHFDITVQQIFNPTVSREAFTVEAQVTGGDAAVGSMLYAVAFLGLGGAALDALHEHGYDVVLVGAPAETCQSRLPDAMCTALANQLSQGISASLPIGASSERAAFLQGVQTLGFAPCGVVLE